MKTAHSGVIKKMELNADDIFGVMNYIKIAADADKFKVWLSRRHDIKDFEGLFEGYKFFIESAIRSFMNALIYDSSLDLGEDYIFFRARFRGVELSKLPNTCEKMILIKNINQKLKAIKRAKDWDSLKNTLQLFDKEVIQTFERIFLEDVGVSHKMKMGKEEALSYITMFYLLIYMTDTHRTTPRGHFVSLLDNGVSERQLQNNFEGYKYALQFVWNSILGDKSFSAMDDMHNAKDWCENDDDFSFESKTEDVEESKGKYLDEYFKIINDGLVTPLENKYGAKPVFDNIFYFNKKYIKKQLKDLLLAGNEPQMTEKDKVDLLLLWYHVDFMDPKKSHIFNGVQAFIRLMVGNAEMRRIFGINDKAHVCKFTHPRKGEQGNDFSYGVLIEAFGTMGIADYSGWMLFFDCCGDYSGFSGSEHSQAEMVIELYKRRGLIEIRGMTLDKEKLKKYIAERIVGPKRKGVIRQLDEVSTLRLEESFISDVKGSVLELITYYTKSKQKEYCCVDWNIQRSGQSIDVLAESADEVVLIECKCNPYNIDIRGDIKKLKDKLRNYNTSKQKRCEFWFWGQPSKRTVDEITNAGIGIISVDEFIEKDLIWTNKKRDVIKQIMSFSQKKQYSGNSYKDEFDEF